MPAVLLPWGPCPCPSLCDWNTFLLDVSWITPSPPSVEMSPFQWRLLCLFYLKSQTPSPEHFLAILSATFFFMVFIAIWYLLYLNFFCLLFIFFHYNVSPTRTVFFVFVFVLFFKSLLYPQCLEQCLAHNKHLTTICWITSTLPIPFLQILNKEMSQLESDAINYSSIRLMEENPKNVKEQVYPHEKSYFQTLLKMSHRKEAGFETVIRVNWKKGTLKEASPGSSSPIPVLVLGLSCLKVACSLHCLSHSAKMLMLVVCFILSTVLSKVYPTSLFHSLPTTWFLIVKEKQHSSFLLVWLVSTPVVFVVYWHLGVFLNWQVT